jgi:hypothetical protein
MGFVREISVFRDKCSNLPPDQLPKKATLSHLPKVASLSAGRSAVVGTEQYGLYSAHPTISSLDSFYTYYRLWRWRINNDLKLDKSGRSMLTL